MSDLNPYFYIVLFILYFAVVGLKNKTKSKSTSNQIKDHLKKINQMIKTQEKKCMVIKYECFLVEREFLMEKLKT